MLGGDNGTTEEDLYFEVVLDGEALRGRINYNTGKVGVLDRCVRAQVRGVGAGHGC